MSMTIEKIDKTNPTYAESSMNDSITLATGAKGYVLFQSPNNSEFAVYQVFIGPTGIAYDVKLEMDMDGSNSWGTIQETVVPDVQTTLFQWVADYMQSFRNKFRLSVTNNEAGDQEFFFFIPCADRADMVNRRY